MHDDFLTLIWADHHRRPSSDIHKLVLRILRRVDSRGTSRNAAGVTPRFPRATSRGWRD